MSKVGCIKIHAFSRVYYYTQGVWKSNGFSTIKQMTQFGRLKNAQITFLFYTPRF